MELLQSKYGVAWPGSAHFPRIGTETGEFRASKPSHRQAMLGRGDGNRTMRWIARGDEPHLREIEGALHLCGQAQVTIVDGIESAAEDAECRDHKDARRVSAGRTRSRRMAHGTRDEGFPHERCRIERLATPRR